MICIISATNRQGSITAVVARKTRDILKGSTGIPVKLLSLESLKGCRINNAMYSAEGQSGIITELQDEYMIPASKFLFILPEYNGSFPGILKFFIDACSVRSYEATFKGKKAGMIGIATGRAGNLRGIDHLKTIMNHVGTEVMSAILPLSSIGACLDENLELDGRTSEDIRQFLSSFVNY